MFTCMSHLGVRGTHPCTEDTFRVLGSIVTWSHGSHVALVRWVPVGRPDFTWFWLRVMLGLCSQRQCRSWP